MFSLGVLLTIAGVFVLARIDAAVAIEEPEAGDSASLSSAADDGAPDVPSSDVAIAVGAGKDGGDGVLHITSGDRSFGGGSDTSSVGYSGANSGANLGSRRSGRRGTAPAVGPGSALLGRRSRRGRRGRRGRQGRRFTLQPTAFPGSFPNHARRRYSVAVLGVGIV